MPPRPVFGFVVPLRRIGELLWTILLQLLSKWREGFVLHPRDVYWMIGRELSKRGKTECQRDSLQGKHNAADDSRPFRKK